MLKIRKGWRLGMRCLMFVNVNTNNKSRPATAEALEGFT
jgi:hypothetical protein